jgi:hypothetical protein
MRSDVRRGGAARHRIYTRARRRSACAAVTCACEPAASAQCHAMRGATAPGAMGRRSEGLLGRLLRELSPRRRRSLTSRMGLGTWRMCPAAASSPPPSRTSSPMRRIVSPAPWFASPPLVPARSQPRSIGFRSVDAVPRDGAAASSPQAAPIGPRSNANRPARANDISVVNIPRGRPLHLDAGAFTR